MEITNIRIKKTPGKKLIGFADIELDNCIVIHNIRILKSKNIFLGMPNKKNKKGEFLDVVHPSNTEFRKKLTKKIYEEFNKN